MCKWNPALKGTDDIRDIVLRIAAQGTGAQSDAVKGGIHCLHQLQQLLLACDDPGQAEYRPCRIIRMNGHLNVIFLTHRLDGL